MGFDQIVSNADTVSILVVVFTPLAAATLVPAVHRFLPWPVEALIWIGMIVVSILRVAGITDSEVREATLSAAWAGGQLVNAQLSALGDALRTWLMDNRFGIATFVIVVAGVDTLTLAVIRSRRAARRAMPQIRLGEWFVMPAHQVEPAADPLVELDRRLAAGMRMRIQSVAHSNAARAVFVKPFAHAVAHVLGPGPARLRMVKLALGFEAREEGSGPIGAGRARSAQPAPLGAGRAHGGRRRHRRGAWPFTPVLRLHPSRKAAQDETASGRRREVKDGAATRQPDRLAS